VRRIVRLGVFVAATPDFTKHPEVANGASDLITAMFGERGKHARAAVGVASLPRGAAVEVDAIVELEG
jgi:enamine deaminase RidA (YjgF/YER057c/UK114 family)